MNRYPVSEYSNEFEYELLEFCLSTAVSLSQFIELLEGASQKLYLNVLSVQGLIQNNFPLELTYRAFRLLRR